MMSIQNLILCLLVMFTHSGMNIGKNDPFGRRFPAKFTRKISMLFWEDPIHSKEWQRAKASYGLDRIAEDLTLLMDEYDVPVRWEAGDIAFVPMMDRAPAAWQKFGLDKKTPGAALGVCGQRWSAWKKERGLSPILGASDEHVRGCAIPRQLGPIPEKNFPGNTGWMGPAGIASAGAALFVTMESIMYHESKKLGNFVSYGTPVHETIHTFNCGHGTMLQEECAKLPNFHLNLVMNGACSGFQAMPRMNVVNDPDKQVCIKDENEKESCMNPKDRRGGGCNNIWKRNMYTASVIGVKRCDEPGEQDWRGYCLVSEGMTCTKSKRFGRGKFTHVLEGLEFVKKNKPCGRNELLMNNGPMWWFCCRGEDVKLEPMLTDEGDPIVDRRIFRSYESFTPRVTKSPVYPTPRSKLPFRIPTYNLLCEDCYCVGLGGALVTEGWKDPNGINGKHTPTFEECRAIAAGKGSKFVSYRPRDGNKPAYCWHSKTCVSDPEKMCMSSSFHKDKAGINTYVIDGADPNEIITDAFGPTIPAGWDVCATYTACASSSKHVSLTPWGAPNDVLKNYFAQCAAVCSEFPFFTHLKNARNECSCHEKCHRQRVVAGKRTTFRKTKDEPQNKCAGVVCKARSQCHDVGVCTNGVCSNPLKRDGSTCDDNNSATTNDVCRAGVCKGQIIPKPIDKCAGVVCKARSQCHDVGVCTNGVCSNPLKRDGATCDDKNSATKNDVCRAGVCKGETIPRPSVCVRNPNKRFNFVDRSTRKTGVSEEECAKLCRDDPFCYGVSFWSADGACVQNRPSFNGMRTNDRAVSFICKAECDTRRKRCCSYNSKWGLIPTQTWGRTPNEEKDWFLNNECHSVMGGKDLTQCPYTCGDEVRRPALIDAAPTTGRNMAEVVNPDPRLKLGEVQCCKEGKCSRRFPADSKRNADCLSGMNDLEKYTFQEAIDMCETLGVGWSLCTRTEVNSNICSGKGCRHDHHLAWAFDDAPVSRRVLSEDPQRKL